MLPWILGAVTGAIVVIVALVLWPALRRRRADEDRRRAEQELAAARQQFQLRRERLEADFEKLAGQSGKPRGLAWAGCDFENEIAFAKDRNSGHLRALVGLTIRFRAVAGGDMEDNPNVGNLRAATAVFHFDGHMWSTDGRPLFNVSPKQAIEHYRHELEVVD